MTAALFLCTAAALFAVLGGGVLLAGRRQAETRAILRQLERISPGPARLADDAMFLGVDRGAGLEEAGTHVEKGVFGAQMQVELVNDGPITMVLETAG